MNSASPSPFPERPPDETTDPLASIRSILLADVRERIRELQNRIESQQAESREAIESLEKQTADLLAQLEKLRRTMQDTSYQIQDLKSDVELLQRKSRQDAKGIIASVKPLLSNIVREAVRDSGPEIAEALGPIMGEAIRVQIRDSREEMVDALYPIIGSLIQKAVSERFRELQRNIDARLRSAFGPRSTLRRFLARLRGVSDAELALRDALPFEIKEVFLIHRTSGMLIARSRQDGLQADDSDLISGMLTAIRSFVKDAFQEDNELDEIQFGEDRIIIQNGAHAYVAAIVAGFEPEGFRTALAELVSNLHLRYNSALRDFDGDPEKMPHFQPLLAQWIASQTGQEEQRPLTRREKIVYSLSGLTAIAFLLLSCFYSVFTVRLLPVAFPPPTPVVSNTPSPTLTPTLTPSPTATFTPTLTPTLTATATFTFTPSPTSTITPSPTVTQTPLILEGVITGTVWVRAEPSASSTAIGWLSPGIRVTVLASYGDWLLISWFDAYGKRQGWAPAAWVFIPQLLPTSIITPLP